MHQRKQNRKKSKSPIPLLFSQIRTFFRRATRGLMRSLSQNFRAMNRRDRQRVAGFVLPTVTMVMLVVVLLTMAIMFRSFDRAQDARYTRASTAVLEAAKPATSRAKAKVYEVMDELETDPSRVISDTELYNTLTLNNKYTFGDEDLITISYDVDGDQSIDANDTDDDLKNNEQIETAWRFPADSDNNGKYDSYILYGIFFRTPELGEDRNPLEARTLPLPPLGEKPEAVCAPYVGSNANLITEEGWVPSLGKLKKSIFVYTVAVPIGEDQAQSLGNDYEAAQGSPSVAPLEYQMDWQQKPLRGVVYRDDLEITPGPAFALNGPLYTASNLITSHFGNGARLYQLSAQDSCFYEEDLSKIAVAGNVINGMTGNTGNIRDVEVDLYQGNTANPITDEISSTNQSTGDGSYAAMYNDAAYRARLTELVEGQMAAAESTDPVEEVTNLKAQLVAEGVDPEDARRQLLERYFIKRLRKVPFAEVAEGGDATAGFQLVGSGDTLRPPDAWTRPLEALTNVSLNTGQLEATEPQQQEEAGVEEKLGDRILVGNNLPAVYLNDNEVWETATLELGGDTWSDGSDRTRVTQGDALPSAGDLSRNGFWERAAAKKPATAISGIGGLRVITGGGIYERLNSFLPPPQWDDPGTGAVTPSPTYDDPATSAVEQFPIVWPDTMPMSPSQGGKVYDNSAGNWTALPATLPAAQTPTIDPSTNQFAKGDLRMRATAVYHYAQDSTDPENDDTDQQPIACVSSYYDPSTSLTAQNMDTLPNGTADGRSNNGIVYPAPTTARPTGANLNATTGLITVTGAASELGNQANLVFPDGRFANEPLRKALIKLSEGRDLDLANQAAIDANLCALDILSGTLNPDNSLIPHGAIREVTLLNAREVKANDADDPATNVDETFTLNSPRTGAQAANLTGNYDLDLPDRQPQEIRLTQLDLNVLRGTTITNTETSDIAGLSPEYLLPYSGIVYATRDDALPDRSYREQGSDADGIDEEFSKALSPSDYQLDPSRRPNGILLINGQALGRAEDVAIGDDGEAASTPEEVLKEKGLTLVSNVPVYIQGSFNLHSQEEFTETLDDDFGNFYNRDTINPDFACRAGDPIRDQLGQACSAGDTWRPATIFADAATLLSENFRFGFRNEGDFDLRNNAANAIVGYDLDGNGNIDAADPTVNEADFGFDLNGSDSDDNGTPDDDTGVAETEITAKAARWLNGFNGYNDFAVNGLSSGAEFQPTATANDGTVNAGAANAQYDDGDYSDSTADETDTNAADSTYFNNFVTPIQRRANFPEYVMEMCLKLPVSACDSDDWVIDNATKASDLNFGTDNKSALQSGTTADPADPNYQRYPRRVAFLRDTSNINKLFLTPAGSPVPIGFDGNTIRCYSPEAGTTSFTKSDTNTINCQTAVPHKAANALWFQTNANSNKNWGDTNPLWYYNPGDPDTPMKFTDGTVQQPLLVPVLQIHATDNNPGVGGFPVGNYAESDTRWVQRVANDEEFNLVLGAGDIPSRPDETNGGMQNLARFLENWGDPQQSTKIFGSFVQSGRSAYATAPYLGITVDEDVFGQNTRYRLNNAGRRIGYFKAPARNWGSDVGLFAQAPDYFTRQFARLEFEVDPENPQEKTYKVNQFFREVGADDPWVKGLLCAKDNGGNDIVSETTGVRPDCGDYEG